MFRRSLCAQSKELQLSSGARGGTQERIYNLVSPDPLSVTECRVPIENAELPSLAKWQLRVAAVVCYLLNGSKIVQLVEPFSCLALA